MSQTKSSSGATRTSVAALAGTMIALVAASARAQPRMPTHVACVGDSITMGVGASSSATNYPTRLQALLGAGTVVRNFGHSGATQLTTGDVPYPRQGEYTTATDFVTNAGADAVVDVIIMLGTNDSKPRNWAAADGGTRASQYAADLGAMVDHFTALQTHPVVYLALPLDVMANAFTISGPVIHDEIIPVIQQVAADKGLPIIDLNTPTAGHPEYFVDGVHPNDGGYVVVAGVMHDGLLRVPQVMLTSPSADATVAPTSEIAVAATASAGTVTITAVEFFAGADSIGTAPQTQSPFTLSWSPAAPGTYALTAKATDSTGAAATSDPVSMTVTGGGGTGGGAASGGGSSGCGCRLDGGGAAARGAGDSGALAAWGASLAGVVVVVAWRRRRRGRRGAGRAG